MALPIETINKIYEEIENRSPTLMDIADEITKYMHREDWTLLFDNFKTSGDSGTACRVIWRFTFLWLLLVIEGYES